MSGSMILGYAYRYPHYDGATVLRFDTGGREINGARPTEGIPLCDARELGAKDAEIARLREAMSEARAFVEVCAKNTFYDVRARLAEDTLDKIDALNGSPAPVDIDSATGCADDQQWAGVSAAALRASIREQTELGERT